MASMSKMLLVIFAIHLTLVLFGIADFPGTSLYNFLINPGDWDSTSFLSTISDLILTLGGAAIIIGTYFTQSDLLVFGGLATIFLSFGLPLAELHSIISAQSYPEVAWLFVSPIILLYVSTLIAFWRGRAD